MPAGKCVVEVARERLELRSGQAAEQVRVAQEPDLDDRNVRVCVDVEEAAGSEGRHERQHQSHDDHGCARPADRKDQRHDQTPGGVGGHVEPLEQPEHPREHIPAAHPLQKAAAGDVDDAARGPRQAEQQVRAESRALQAERGERGAPDQHADQQWRGEPAPAHEHDRQRGAHDPAEAERRVQEPHTRAPGAEDAVGHEHAEQVEGAEDDPL